MENTLTLANTLNIETPSIDVSIINDKMLSNYYKHLDTSSKDTIKSYKMGIIKFLNWINVNNYQTINDDVILDYKNYLKDNYKPSSINAYIMSVKSLFNYLETKGSINYAKGIKRVKDTRDYKHDALTKEQMVNILNSLKWDTEQDARDGAIITLMLMTGLRECEVVRANYEDFKVIGDTQTLKVQGKGRDSKDNLIVIKSRVNNAIQKYLSYRHNIEPSSPLFVGCGNKNNGQRLTTRTIQRIVIKAYRDNDIHNPSITTHSLRHSAITQSILNGASLTQAQAMARHSSPNTTMIYFHNINRLTDNAESILDKTFQNI